MSGDLLVLLGQLLGISVAAGLNLYATVALLGIASRFDGLLALPPELRGLEDPLLIASAGLLYLIEFTVDKVPFANSLWDAVHTVIRPLAAGLIALGLLAQLPMETRLAGATLAVVFALGAHGAKAGLRLTITSSRPGRRLGFAISVLEDLAAVGLLATALVHPAAAIAIVGASVLASGLVGPRLWRAFVMFLRALDGRIRGFFRPAGWREAGELPRSLRRLVPAPALGSPPVRATRAAIRGLNGVGDYRNGWLVQTPYGFSFLYRSLFGPQARWLPPARVHRLIPGGWVDTVELEGDDALCCTVYLLKDGPPADLALAELAPAVS